MKTGIQQFLTGLAKKTAVGPGNKDKTVRRAKNGRPVQFWSSTTGVITLFTQLKSMLSIPQGR
jgi:hypothetical protein